MCACVCVPCIPVTVLVILLNSNVLVIQTKGSLSFVCQVCTWIKRERGGVPHLGVLSLFPKLVKSTFPLPSSNWHEHWSNKRQSLHRTIVALNITNITDSYIVFYDINFCKLYVIVIPWVVRLYVEIIHEL